MRKQSLYSNWVVKLVIINIIVFIIQNIFESSNIFNVIYGCQGSMTRMPGLLAYLGLTPALVAEKGFIFQVVTYMFLHGNMWHILFNMYALFIFGMPIEQTWGSRRFLFYFFFTGIGAGITILAMNLVMFYGFGNPAGYCIPTIGASGAVFGILLAFGILYPNVEILLFFFLPLRAKYLVILYGGIEMYLLISSGGQGGISHIGHLGGLLFGIIFFLVARRHTIRFKGKQFKARAEVHMEKKQVGPADDVVFLKAILDQVKKDGGHSIDDDSYQRLQYLIIMNDEQGLCAEEDFNEDDDYCKKCDNMAACYVREIKKYLS